MTSPSDRAAEAKASAETLSPSNSIYTSIIDTDKQWSQLAALKMLVPADHVPRLKLVDLTDADDCTRTRKVELHDAAELKNHLKFSTGRIQYVSICQKNSWANLDVCRPMLQCLMREHSIMLEFLEVARSFRDKTSDFELGFGGTSWKRCSQNSKEITFILKYPESNGRTDGADPWSIRQTGIYQKFYPSSKTSLWILLNPRQDTAADIRIEDLLKPQRSFSSSHQRPISLGLVVLSTYLTNWRSFMEYSEKEEMRITAIVSTTVLDEKLRFNHSVLTELRYLETRLLPLLPIFQSLEQNIHLLQAYNDDLWPKFSSEDHELTKQTLENYSAIVRAYSENVSFLLNKIRGTAQLLSDTLNLKHQQTTQSIDENTLMLTSASVRDSATIRVITVVTLLYLPTTFIATVFGMQFFATSPTGHLTAASSQLWIFFALAATFTAATFGFWKWMEIKHRQNDRTRGSKAIGHPEP